MVRELGFWNYRAAVAFGGRLPQWGSTRCFMCLITAFSGNPMSSCARSSRLVAAAMLDGEGGRPLRILLICAVEQSDHRWNCLFLVG
uniref:Uncharacterized protein n=1 Tax=Arundo donax TaxID=35708 RepID=A0A0A9CNK8_ARUDO